MLFRKLTLFPAAYLNDDLEYANITGRAFSVAIDMICLIVLLKFCSGIFRWILWLKPISMELADKIKFKLHLEPEEITFLKTYTVKYLIFNIIQLITSIVATITFYMKFQTSPGAWILKIKLLNEKTMQSPTLGKFCKRLACFFLNAFTLGLSYMIIRFTKKRQALHDKMTGTIVVKARRTEGYLKLFAANNNENINVIDRFNRKIVSLLPQKIQKFLQRHLIK